MPRDYTRNSVGANRQRVGNDTSLEDDLTVIGRLILSGEQSEQVGTTKTLDAGDSGVKQLCPVTTTITLPATAVGLFYWIEIGGEDGTVTVTVSPNASDMISGNGVTAANDKDFVCTLGNKGDALVLLGDGTAGVGWNCVFVRGTWVKES